MACYKPIQAYRSPKGHLVFSTKEGFIGNPIPIACGQCIGCRLERSRVWAMRCMHEAQLHDSSWFLTLTYNNENLPLCNSLCKRHLRNFWKGLRKKHSGIRYYACGEYGDESGRAHYHAIVFGLEVPDRKLHCISDGNNIYVSEEIEKIWNKGFVILGSVSFESCGYVARYVMKKQTGKGLKKYYVQKDEDGNPVGIREKEFNTMSRRPGIGKEFYEKFKKDIYQEGTDGRIIIRGGISSNSPRYYDNFFKHEKKYVGKPVPFPFEYINDEKFNSIQQKRKEEAEKTKFHEDNSPDRLEQRKRVVEGRVNKQLTRNLELRK